jgi:Mg/Co/Ni transporter MgtE
MFAITSAIAIGPILVDAGGNAGGQSSATIIRSLALKEIEVPD